MTTIIVVVVVALVFFVAVCVVAFMIWKREAEMRTDSIRAIEENLERLTQEMSPGQEAQDRQGFAEKEADISYMESLVAQSAAGRSSGRRARSRVQDPFEWVRANGETVRSSSGSVQEEPFRIHPVSAFEEEGQKTPDRDEEFYVTTEPVVHEMDNGDGMAGMPAVDTDVSETADGQQPSEGHDRYEDSGTGEDTCSDEGDLTEKTETEVCRKKSALTEMHKMLKELDVPEMRKMPGTPADEDAVEPSEAAGAEGEEMQETVDGDHDDREEQHDEKESYEISLDLIDEMDIDSEQEQMPAARMGYDVGRSGRKYTASELEKLIKE